MPILSNRFRLGLLPRIAVALVVLALVPLLSGVLPTARAIREALLTQVLRTHALAARATSARVASRVTEVQDLANALASNPLLLAGPLEPAAQEVLRSTLATRPSLGAVRIANPLGQEVVRAQRPSVAEMIAPLFDSENTGGALEIHQLETSTWLRVDVLLEEGRGRLQLVDRDDQLAQLLDPEDLGGEAVMTVLDRDSKAILGDTSIIDILPEEMTVLSQPGHTLGGSQRFTDRQGQTWIGAVEPIPGTEWTVVTLQPRRVAEATSLRLKRDVLLAVGVAIVFAVILIFLAWTALVRPIRALLQSQSADWGGGNELTALRNSLEQLGRRERDREELGQIFLGRYQVLERVGEGAMGMVFRGWDPTLQRPVALKTVRLAKAESRSGSPNSVQSLVSEAVKGAQFNHSHIVSVFDAEGIDDAAFIAMEFVAGTSAESLLLEHGRVDAPLVVVIAIAVAEALNAAHQLDIIHRDIKPANVLLGYGGTIKVTDFGIADFVNSMSAKPGRVFGTPGFLAPEVIRGGPAGPRADLFALGVTAYWMLTGRHPFHRPKVSDTLIETLRREPTPLGEVVATLPSRLEAIVMALLAKDPEGRPESAAAVVAELEDILREEGWASRFELANLGEGVEARVGKPSSTQWMATHALHALTPKAGTATEGASPPSP